MRALVEAARERGVRRFRASTLRDNTRAIALLESLDGGFTVHADGALLVYDVDLPAAADEDKAWDPFHRLLKFAAEGIELIFHRLAGHV
jgi:ribosomal protein S18 acetylase RimI-like enzyme